jgi:hypothetical protein
MKNMTPAFILRFQENCLEIDSSKFKAGTMTQTRVDSEHPDNDYHSFFSPLRAGTITSTRIATEQSDKDHSLRAVTIPKTLLKSLTKTFTFTEAEASDSDPGHTSNRILPR